MKRSVATLLVVLIALPLTIVAIAGCGQTSTADAEAQLRKNLNSFKQSLTGLLDINSSTSASSLKASWQKVEDSWNAVVESSKDVKNAKISDLDDAYNELKKAISDVSSGQSIGATATSILAAIAVVQIAWQQVYSSLQSNQ